MNVNVKRSERELQYYDVPNYPLTLSVYRSQHYAHLVATPKKQTKIKQATNCKINIPAKRNQRE